MVRKLGFVTAALLVVLAAQRVLMPFQLQVGSQFDGEDVLPVYKGCGRAAFVLLVPEEELADVGPGFGADCSRTARTRALEASGSLVLAAGAAVIGVRGRIRHVESIEHSLRPLPKVEGFVAGRTRRTEDAKGRSAAQAPGSAGEGPGADTSSDGQTPTR